MYGSEADDSIEEEIEIDIDDGTDLEDTDELEWNEDERKKRPATPYQRRNRTLSWDDEYSDQELLEEVDEELDRYVHDIINSVKNDLEQYSREIAKYVDLIISQASEDLQVEEYINFIIRNICEDLDCLDEEIDNFVQTIINNVRDELLVDTDIGTYVKQVIQAAVESLSREKLISSDESFVSRHSTKDSLYSRLAPICSPSHLDEDEMLIISPSRENTLVLNKYKPLPPIRRQITDHLPKWTNESRVGSLEKLPYIPGGGDKKIFNETPKWHVSSKIGSLENIDHRPGGGNVKLPKNKTNWSYQSKIGSLESLRLGRQLLMDLGIYEDFMNANAEVENALHGTNSKKENSAAEFTKQVKWAPDVVDRHSDFPRYMYKYGGYHGRRKKYDPGYRNDKLRWKGNAKIGSFDNIGHCPGGGDKQIPEYEAKWNHIPSRINAHNARHIHKAPRSTNRIFNEKLAWKARSKVGSLRSLHYIPPGSNIVIQQYKDNFNLEDYKQVIQELIKERKKHADERLKRWRRDDPEDNADNIDTVELGDYDPAKDIINIEQESLSDNDSSEEKYPINNIKEKRRLRDLVENETLNLNSRFSKIKPKIDTQHDVPYTPRGGNIKIQDEPVHWEAESKIGSFDNIRHMPKFGHFRVPSRKLVWGKKSLVGSLDNVNHKPGGGQFPIPACTRKWKAKAKIGSLDNIDHLPSVTDKKVYNEPQNWDYVKPKVKSKKT